MKKFFILISAMLVSLIGHSANVNFFNRVDVSGDASDVRLQNVALTYIATRTEVRQRPGCFSNGEVSEDCNQTVVLERKPAIDVTIYYRSYQDASAEEGDRAYTSVLLDPALFSGAEVEKLKAAYPGWRHPFSRAGLEFAKNYLKVSANRVKREIQVLDFQKSKLCSVNGESGDIQFGCVEHLVYKKDFTTVTEIEVGLK